MRKTLGSSESQYFMGVILGESSGEFLGLWYARYGRPPSRPPEPHQSTRLPRECLGRCPLLRDAVS